MPTSTLTPGDERQEEKLNPGQQDYDRRFNNIADSEKRGTADGDSYDKDTGSNQIEKIRNKESEGAGWQNNTSAQSTENKKQTQKGIFKDLAKKKGPIAAILGIVGIGGFGVSILFSPAILIVQMKETMVDKFNSQLAAMDIRSGIIMSKRLGNEILDGTCSPVNIRCRFSSMSKKQIARLEKAGITALDKDGKLLKANKLGRGRPAKIIVDGKELTASDIRKQLRRDPALRSSFSRVYNPKFAAFSDSISKKVNKKLKISKKNHFAGANSDKDFTKKMHSTVSGDDFGIKNDPNIKEVTETDPETGEKKTSYYDSSSDPPRKLTDDEVSTRRAALAEVDSELKKRADMGKVGKKIGKSAVKSTLTVTAVGLGAADSACSGYQLIRTAGFAAKHIGMLQLVRYASTFMNTADAIKAGEATPQQVEYLANIATSTNSEGKSATDSYGYKYAAYGEVGGKPAINKNTSSQEEAALADEINRYVNGQLVSKNVLTDIISFIGKGDNIEAVDKACGFAKSGWGQTIVFGSAILGAGLAVVSGGLSLGWGAAAQVGVGISLAVAMAIATPKIIDMASGTLVNGTENGNEAGNAIASGMGAYNAQASQARGLAVLNKEDAVAYQNITNETIALYSDTERLESNPFDVMNKNTFIGSIVSKLIPHIPRNTSSIVGSIFGSFSSASMSLRSTFTSKAASVDEFSKCDDNEYEGLAADPFCNLQYGIKPASLEIDPDEVLNELIGTHIDEMTGDPTSDKFKDYIKYCVERENPIGAYEEGEDVNDLTTGKKCTEGNAGADNRLYTMFRLYLIDKSIIDGMDEEEAVDSDNPTTSTASPNADKSKLYEDSSSIACAPGTNDAGTDTGYRNGVPVKIRLCSLPNTKIVIGESVPARVNSRISADAFAMFEDMKSSLGLSVIAIHDSYRTMEEQRRMVKNKGAQAAKAGYSNHQMGLALDINMGTLNNGDATSYLMNKNNAYPTSRPWKWLVANGANYGFTQNKTEGWHWEVTAN